MRGSGAGLLAWSPLTGSVLTEKYLGGDSGGDDASGSGDSVSSGSPPVDGVVAGVGAYRFKAYPRFQERFMAPRALEATAQYQQIAQGAGMTLTRLALRWAASRWFMASIIVGATSMAQLAANIDDLDGDGPDWAVTLDPALSRAIDEVYLVYRDPVASI